MGERPTGVVTFLFTDIEGSTARWEADPHGMRVALARHDEVLSGAIADAGGWMFKHTGDGVLAAFERPDAALEAAAAAQLVLGLPVRMGIATGQAEHRNDDYFGPVLNKAARVMSAGHGGQILVADSTVALLDGADLIDLGSHRLSGISKPVRIHQVRVDGLNTEFPALSVSDRGWLPVAAGRLVGRERELAEVSALLETHQVVTLTGVGGVGKTRLALAVAEATQDRYRDGAWFVELASVESDAAIATLVASTLGIAPGGDRTIEESLLDALASRRTLVVLDNCEHLIDGVAALVDRIVARCPGTSFLTTSREALMVDGEQSWTVPSLRSDAGVTSPSVELFLERARAVAPDWDAGAESDDVVEICRQLEGIPLAIELAAARVRSLGAADIRSRLHDRFRLLSGGRRRSLERHQTLRHAVGWSYDLLAPEEQAVLMSLSVFASGFGLRAAEVVCAQDGIAESDVIDHLDSLVRKSLISPDRAHAEIRFRQLETIRQFAEEALVQSGRADEVRERHAHFFADEADEMFEVWRSPRQLVATEWCAREMDNLRVAFTWSADGPDPDPAIRLAASVGDIARFQQLHEAYSWAVDILETARRVRSPRLTMILTWAASNAWGLGHDDDAERYGLEAIELADHPDFESFVWAYVDVATVVVRRGEIDRAIEFVERGAAHPADARDRMNLAFLPWLLAAVGRHEEALRALDDAMPIVMAAGIPMAIACSHLALGMALGPTDPDRAVEALERAIEASRDGGVSMVEASALAALAEVLAGHGDTEPALRRLEQMLEWSVRSIDEGILRSNLISLAVVLAGDGVVEPVVTVLGWARYAAIGSARREQIEASLRSEIGVERFETLHAAGASMTHNEIVLFALEQVRQRLAAS